MKLGELKVIHIILVISIILWAYLFFDWQKTKYQLQYEAWRTQVNQSVNYLANEINVLKGGGQSQPLLQKLPQNPSPKKGG